MWAQISNQALSKNLVISSLINLSSTGLDPPPATYAVSNPLEDGIVMLTHVSPDGGDNNQLGLIILHGLDLDFTILGLSLSLGSVTFPYCTAQKKLTGKYKSVLQGMIKPLAVIPPSTLVKFPPPPPMLCPFLNVFASRLESKVE